MKTLVYAHRLDLGGTQTNAIELAEALRDRHGFDVTIFAAPGPMINLIEEKKLRFVPAPDAFVHPSMRRMRALKKVLHAVRPDVIHIWDWWQALDVLYAVPYFKDAALLITDMMMSLTRVLPRYVPTTFGTPEIADKAVRAGWRRASVLVPPVDVERNSPASVDAVSFREKHGVSRAEILIVTVSRLANYMKSESLYRSIEVIASLAGRYPLRFAVIGDGPARNGLQERADEINAALGRRVIVFTGALLDPRPAYAAADIVVGMGGSALRGMAFGKPVVVVGERGFCTVLSSESAADIYFHGLFGVGDGDPENARLTSMVEVLLTSSKIRRELGSFSRAWVVENFSLEKTSQQLAACLRDAAEHPIHPTARMLDSVRSAALYLRERRFSMHSRDSEPIEWVVDKGRNGHGL